MAATPKEKKQAVKPRGPIKEGTKLVVGQAVTRPRRRRIPRTCVACEDAHFCYAMVLANNFVLIVFCGPIFVAVFIVSRFNSSVCFDLIFTMKCGMRDTYYFLEVVTP
jgi:hypothetical protein